MKVPSSLERAINICYNAGKPKTPTIRKTTIYKCGCKVILDDMFAVNTSQELKR